MRKTEYSIVGLRMLPSKAKAAGVLCFPKHDSKSGDKKMLCMRHYNLLSIEGLIIKYLNETQGS